MEGLVLTPLRTCMNVPHNCLTGGSTTSTLKKRLKRLHRRDTATSASQRSLICFFQRARSSANAKRGGGRFGGDLRWLAGSKCCYRACCWLCLFLERRRNRRLPATWRRRLLQLRGGEPCWRHAAARRGLWPRSPGRDSEQFRSSVQTQSRMERVASRAGTTLRFSCRRSPAGLTIPTMRI